MGKGYKWPGAAEQDALNLKHSLHPKAGDYWHEMFMPVAIVIQVNKFCVIYCEDTMQHPDHPDSKTWNPEKVSVLTRKEWAKRWRYGRIGKPLEFEPTDTDDISNKCWCDVMPQHHKPATVRSWFEETA